MAKGAIAKAEIQKRILATFEGAFLYNDGKEIRVPMMENGEQVQIKVALTCAKENVVMGADVALPGDFPTPKNEPVTEEPKTIAPSADEKKAVADLFKKLGL